MTGRASALGHTNLALDQKKLDALGFRDVMRPVSTSCADHMGSTWSRVHTWDGKSGNFSSTGTKYDDSDPDPMVKGTGADRVPGRQR